MPPERVERKLAAILAADVAGYSRLIGADEEGTLRRLKAHRSELIDPKIAEHRGRIVKVTGDGVLAEFPSAVGALRCAIEVQRAMAERNASEAKERRIEFRIGLHQGDIVVEDGDILGDGVNVAARLEALADPGCICVSQRIREDTAGKVDVVFEDLGEQQLKNIERRVHIFQVGRDRSRANDRAPLALPDKPSVAVLPFQNMSGDPQQEYFADGMVEEIITALSRFRQLFVIARNSSFTYKNRTVDVKQVGRELGVRYVLEGSVRKATQRIRITAQLVDATTGAHLWAERFDGALEDVFDLQDRVTASVVGAVAPKLERAEMERTKHKTTGRLDAYDYFLRGLAAFYQGTNDANSTALRLFSKATELDPEFASAYGMAARCYTWRRSNGWSTGGPGEIGELKRLAQQAVKLGRDDALALCTGGFALAHAGELDQAEACIERSISLNSNLAWAWYHGGWVSVWCGKSDEAIERMTRALRLSPVDPLTSRMHAGIAFAHFLAGHYDDACAAAEAALMDEPRFIVALRIVAASHAMAGRLEEAHRTIARLLELNPSQRISNLKDWPRFRRPEHSAVYELGLRRAGLLD